MLCDIIPGVLLDRSSRAFGVCVAITLTACSPEQGDLLPDTANGRLLTKDFKDDTVEVTQSGVTIAARGQWRGGNLVVAYLTLECANTAASAVVLNLAAAEPWRLVSRPQEPAAAFSLKPGERRTLDLILLAGPQGQVVGQTVELRIPLNLDTSATHSEHRFRFRYAKSHVSLF